MLSVDGARPNGLYPARVLSTMLSSSLRIKGSLSCTAVDGCPTQARTQYARESTALIF